MGEHIHFKDGKYNVWSSITDSYHYEKWLDPEPFFNEYLASRLYFETKKLIGDIKEGMKEAEENKGCSIPYPNMRCSKI